MLVPLQISICTLNLERHPHPSAPMMMLRQMTLFLQFLCNCQRQKERRKQSSESYLSVFILHWLYLLEWKGSLCKFQPMNSRQEHLIYRSIYGSCRRSTATLSSPSETGWGTYHSLGDGGMCNGPIGGTNIERNGREFHIRFVSTRCRRGANLLETRRKTSRVSTCTHNGTQREIKHLLAPSSR